MTGELETRRKARIKIEREAHPALLSFKGGATSSQVEERILDLFGMSYSDKYQLAGVENMHQILSEHPQVRQRRDGKFEIIANEDNKDLVALVSKQKDRFGSRSKSCIGYRHKHSPRVFSRLSPKQSRLKRPITAMTKRHVHKTLPNTSQTFFTNYNQYYTSSNVRAPKTPHRIGVTMNHPAQRPLVHPKTSIPIDFNQTLPSYLSPVGKTAQLNKSNVADSEFFSVCGSDQMPSIKQFSQNVKRMMEKIHPGTVSLNCMTDQYFKEYNVLIDPVKLYSKNWKMLLKSTFKDWLHINGEEVAMKQNYQRQSSLSSENVNKTRKTAPSCLQNVQNPNVNQPILRGKELRAPVVNSISPSVLIRQLKDFNIGTRNMLPTPEKPPGSISNTSGSNMNPIMKFLVGGKRNTPSKKSPQKLSSYGPFVQMHHCAVSDDYSYDARELSGMRNVEVDEKLKIYVTAALNEHPHLKKRRTGASKNINRLRGSPRFDQSSIEAFRNASSNMKPSASRDVSMIFFDSTLDSNSDSPSSLSPPDSKPVRMRLDEKSVQLTKSRKDVEPLYILPSENPGGNVDKRRYVPLSSYYTKEIISKCSRETMQRSTTSIGNRKLLLPPMSKGVLPKAPPMLQSSSNVQTTASSSASSMFSKIKEMRDKNEEDLW